MYWGVNKIREVEKNDNNKKWCNFGMRAKGK